MISIHKIIFCLPVGSAARAAGPTGRQDKIELFISCYDVALSLSLISRALELIAKPITQKCELRDHRTRRARERVTWYVVSNLLLATI
jgi:hypothetical protein